MAEPARVALLVTCLVDLFRPSVGCAAVKLLEQAGCAIGVPAQTCCGQPAYNSGDKADAKAIARQVIAAFAGYDYVVAPSGSCAGMVKVHYPEMFADEPATLAQAQELASRTYELVAFLVDVRGMDQVTARWPRRAIYHDACSGLRELGVKQQPRALLASVDGLQLTELPGAEVCCGFGAPGFRSAVWRRLRACRNSRNCAKRAARSRTMCWHISISISSFTSETSPPRAAMCTGRAMPKRRAPRSSISAMPLARR